MAVPFFFCCTGYFIAEKGIENRAVVGAFIKKAASSYFFCSLIYIPVELIKMAGLHTLNKATLLHYFHYAIVQGSFLHLWYYPAVIISLACLYYLLKHLPIRPVGMICAGLYLLGLLGDGYYGLLRFLPSWCSKLMEVYQAVFLTTRNGLFFGIPFVFVGICLSKAMALKSIKSPLRWFLITLVCGGIEIYFLRRFGIAADYNMTVFIVPATAFLFSTLLNSHFKTRIDTVSLRLSSMRLYQSHLFFYGIILALLTLFELPILENRAIQFFTVWAASQTFATFLLKKRSIKKLD